MQDTTIPCTACDEPVPVEETDCPACGKSFITRQQAKMMILYVYPVVLPVPALLLSAAIPPAWYGDVHWLAGFAVLAVVFYSLASGWTWLIYSRRQEQIEQALAAAD